jgi:hypothetical protein
MNIFLRSLMEEMKELWQGIDAYDNHLKCRFNLCATSAYYVTDKEWKYSMLYLYTNMVEVEPYFEKFDKNILDI